MLLDASLINAQHYKVCIKGKVGQSRKRSCARHLHLDVVTIEKEDFGSLLTTVANTSSIYVILLSLSLFLSLSLSISLSLYIYIYENYSDLEAYVLDKNITVNESELQSHYFVHFQTTTLRNDIKPLYHPGYGLNIIPTVFLRGWHQKPTNVDIPLKKNLKPKKDNYEMIIITTFHLSFSKRTQHLHGLSSK